VGGYFKSELLIEQDNSADLNDPPTPVGGIDSQSEWRFYRKDLNDPPTAVGGIQNASTVWIIGTQPLMPAVYGVKPPL